MAAKTKQQAQGTFKHLTAWLSSPSLFPFCLNTSLPPHPWQEWEAKAAEAKKEYEEAMKEYKASLKTTTPTKKSPKKAAPSAAAAAAVSPTKAGSGSGFKSKEFIDESSSSEDSDDKPLKKKAKTEKPEKAAKKPKKVNVFLSFSSFFIIWGIWRGRGMKDKTVFLILPWERQVTYPRKNKL